MYYDEVWFLLSRHLDTNFNTIFTYATNISFCNLLGSSQLLNLCQRLHLKDFFLENLEGKEKTLHTGDTESLDQYR